MADGYLKGIMWGGVASAVSLVGLSVFSDGPQKPSVTAEAPDGAGSPGVDLDVTQRSSGDRVPVAGREATRAPAPVPDGVSTVLSDAARTAVQPLVGAATELQGSDEAAQSGETDVLRAPTASSTTSLREIAPPVAPVADQQAVVVTGPADLASLPAADVQAEEPGPSTSIVQAPDVSVAEPPTEQVSGAPSQEVETSISVDPAQPLAPDLAPADSGFAAADVAEGLLPPDGEGDEGYAGGDRRIPAEDTPQPAPRVDADVQVGMIDLAVVVQEEMEAKMAQGDDAPIAVSPKPDTLLPSPGSDTSPEVSTSPADPLPALVDAPAAAEPEPTALAPVDTAQAPPTARTTPEPAPETPLSEPSAPAIKVRINRLPTLGGQTEPDQVTAQEQNLIEQAPQPSVLPVELPPVARFAEPIEDVGEKPRMAILLIDEGVDLSGEITGLQAIRDFPYPVSFAVDALMPDAAERMRAYRAAGFEVLAVVDLPTGARAQDAEVSLGAALDALPEVLGVLEGVETGVQTTRDAATHVADFLADTGHGFVAQNRGLNTAQKLAARSGVPSAVVFRDFDGNAQTERVIRRFLDQAAFRAGQEGGVVMLGRLRPGTISALAVWGLQDRAERVALVPVSQVLMVQVP